MWGYSFENNSVSLLDFQKVNVVYLNQQMGAAYPFSGQKLLFQQFLHFKDGNAANTC